MNDREHVDASQKNVSANDTSVGGISLVGGTILPIEIEKATLFIENQGTLLLTTACLCGGGVR